MAVDEQKARDWWRPHLDAYLRTDGREGHVIDLSEFGGTMPTPTLILRTIGRKSGKPILLPLIYVPWGDGYAIVASKGGAPQHPAWYLNLIDRPDCAFQIGGKKWEGSWRIAEGEERAKLWAYLIQAFPPYVDYQDSTDRVIPIVVLKPGLEIAAL